MNYTHRAKLCDFGFSRWLENDDSVLLGGVSGTPAWMAPEVIREKPVGTMADIYGVGLVMWEMLSGKRPYDGMGIEEVNVYKSCITSQYGQISKCTLSVRYVKL